jgi:myo-inositol-1-phosphate synthase
VGRYVSRINTGGIADSLNMLNRERPASKKKSKTKAVQSVAAVRLEDGNIHIGPSDYVPWQYDNKVCFIRVEGTIFGGVPMNPELGLSVEDLPNSAGIVIDAMRCRKLALKRGIGGVLQGPAAHFMKHPPIRLNDDGTFKLTEAFIEGSYAQQLRDSSLQLRRLATKEAPDDAHRSIEAKTSV